MKNVINIGIIGLGYVGTAIQQNCDETWVNLCLLDTDPNKHTTGTYEDLHKCDGVFICVPSPQLPDGSCDGSILENVLSNFKNYRGVIISKTTLTPDIYSDLQKKYSNLVYCPEFLTANNSVVDYAAQDWVIIGGNTKAYQQEANRIIKHTKQNTEPYYCTIEEAALVKYTINSFLATKVVFMNEMFALSKKIGSDWNVIRELLALDNRIGHSHTRVPGPDGFYGFGGMCFPKDTSALLYHADNLGVSLSVLKEAVQKNTLLRLHEPK